MIKFIEKFLRKIVLSLPKDKVEFITLIYRKLKLIIESIKKNRKILTSKRIEFLNLETAWLCKYSFLSPDKNQVLIETLYSAVSNGTESSVFSGSMPKGFPNYPGYSAVGKVIFVPKTVKTFEIGDIVAGRIKHCKKSSVSQNYLFKVPKNCNIQYSAFIEIGIIVLQGIRKAKILPGMPTLVIGLGIIGQMTVRLARISGACPLHCTASTSKKADFSIQDNGADLFRTINSIEENSYDVIFDVTGNSKALNLAIDAVSPNGKIILLGSNRIVSKNVNIDKLSKKNVSLIGAHITSLAKNESNVDRWTYRHEGELFFNLLSNKKLSLKSVITNKINPEEANSFYESLGDRKFDGIGVVFDWSLIK